MAYYFSVEVKHEGLNKYRIVKGQTPREANAKANALSLQWAEQWERKCEAERNRKSREADQLKRERTRLEHEANAAEAVRLTLEAEQLHLRMGSILLDSLKIKPKSWTDFHDKSKFTDKEPNSPRTEKLLPLPLRTAYKYNPELSFLQKISKKKQRDIKFMNDSKFNNDLKYIEEKNSIITQENEKAKRIYQEALDRWNSKKTAFVDQQNAYNTEIDERQKAYNNADSDAIAFFYDNIITNVKDPYEFDRQVEVEYRPDAKMLLIEMYFPTVSELPNTKKVTYVKSSGEFKESAHPSSYMNNLYDDVIYQTILQTFYLVFLNDKDSKFIDSAVINGKVETIDKTTGKNITPTILSVAATKDDIDQLNLEQIDSKAWFKNSKGISAARISNITPVAPIIELDKSDSRFVEGYDVMHEVDDSINLASMDWQDFENLIRELFHSEFNINGGEVKITQASRDGGVDAVAFDPSPIRGGKIVIQAKRYTNVVGVSAVRDLYGTVLNEGAMKGILITTSNYGNDAYKFAQGKPLTLLNGANLLSMLESHGYKARIDIRQAREEMKAERKQ